MSTTSATIRLEKCDFLPSTCHSLHPFAEFTQIGKLTLSLQVIQNVGEIIWVLYGGYHQGFNLGKNLAEATNLLLDESEWGKWAAFAVNCTCGDPIQVCRIKFLMKMPWFSKWLRDELCLVYPHSTSGPRKVPGPCLEELELLRESERTEEIRHRIEDLKLQRISQSKVITNVEHPKENLGDGFVGTKVL